MATARTRNNSKPDSTTRINRSHTVGFSPDNKPDDNLAGLYRPERIVGLLGKKVRFIAPAQVQRALIVQFLLLALQDLVSTTRERQEMTKDELFERCMKRLQVTTITNPTPQQQQQSLQVTAALFANAGANQYFLDVLSQSFPDLERPELLTDDALTEAGMILFNAFLES